MPDPDHSTPVRHARGSDGELAAPGIVRQLSELARELRADTDMESLLDHIVAATVDEIDGADFGGITLIEGGQVKAVSSTDPLVERMDQRQNDLNEGPCLSSLREQITVRADDFETEDRWPRFVAAAREEHVGSMLSVQLFVDDDNLGALNLYAGKRDAFSNDDEYTAMALAAHAAVALKGKRVEDNLRIGLGSRDLIGQAKGILMERYKIDADEAFNLLVMASQSSQVKLRDVADLLTQTGELQTERRR